MAVLHGDRSQGQRESAMRAFRRGRARILVATDIAARGIDVDDVELVVNHDVPRAAEDYVHRIGRTGRMQARGEAITLASPEERDEVTAIERFLGARIERRKLDDFAYDRKREPDDVMRHLADGPESRSHSGRRHARVRETGSRHARASEPGRRHASEPARSEAQPVAAAASATHGRRPRRNAGDRRGRRRL